MCMHGVECCGENPQDAPSFHSYVSSVPEFRVRHKKSPLSFIFLCLYGDMKDERGMNLV